MDKSIRDALRELRRSAAECGYPLDHLTDAEIVEAVGVVSLQIHEEGHAISLLQAGIQKVGNAFVDLQRAGYMIAT